MKRFNDRFQTAKRVYSLLNKHKEDPGYSSSLFAEDMAKLLREMIMDLEKTRFTLVMDNYDVSSSQIEAYNKCHEAWCDSSLTPSEQLHKSYESFLGLLNESEHGTNGYSIAEAICLHKLSRYELLQTERYKGASDYILIRGVQKLKRINAIGVEEAEKLMKNACLKLLVIELRALKYSEDEIKDIISEVESYKDASKMLEILKRGGYITSQDLISSKEGMGAKQ